MVGVLGWIGEYNISSNREAGDGRPDILMEPFDNCGSVLIFEFKKADKFGQMDALCDAALAQVEEKNYDAQSKEQGYENFIKYGICFCKKVCKVKVRKERVKNGN